MIASNVPLRRLGEELQHLLAADVGLELDLAVVLLLELLDHRLLFIAGPAQHAHAAGGVGRRLKIVRPLQAATPPAAAALRNRRRVAFEPDSVDGATLPFLFAMSASSMADHGVT